MTSQVDLTDPRTREQLAKQYQPLVFKIANQQKNKTALSYDDVIGFANEGLAVALNEYDPDKGQTFKQYAGYMILYYIQNGSNSCGHTVTFSAYMQKKARDAGQSTWIMKSIDVNVDSEGNEKCNVALPVVEPEVNREAILGTLYKEIEHHFSRHDYEIFYKSYGLKEYGISRGVDLARAYGCSGPNITLICKKIINFIKHSPSLMDELSELL